MARRGSFMLKAAIIWMVLASFSAFAAEEVRVEVFPDVSAEPAQITIRVEVRPDEDNRAVEVVTDSAAYYRRSTQQLDGDNAAVAHVFRYRDVPAGDYVISVRVLSAGGRSIAVARAYLKITR
jgi:methionine-rich copper-binding protein CopC